MTEIVTLVESENQIKEDNFSVKRIKLNLVSL